MPILHGIHVKFKREVEGDDNLAHTFRNVVNVEWQNEYAREFLVDRVTEVGKRITKFTVNGYVFLTEPQSDNILEQSNLENILRLIATGTFSYGQLDDEGVDGVGDIEIPEVRFLSLDFQEYRGGPVSFYTAKFVTETTNIHAHAPVVIGALTLDMDDSFEPPQVEDSISTQGPDEHLHNLFKRKFVIRGRMVGTLAQVNAAQAALIAEVEVKSTIIIDLSSATGGVMMVVRPGNLTFSSPEPRLADTARSYSFECVTHDDYTKEPYTIGHLPLTFGSITIDVVSKIDYTLDGDHEGGSYTVVSENVSIGGKKYFTGWDVYDIFVQSFQPLPLGVHFYGAPNTYQELELRNISIGDLQRDGNFPSTAKRFSADVSLNYIWNKNLTETNQNYTATLLGVLWHKVSSTSHSFTVDAFGNVTSRSVNLSGQIFDTDLTILKGKMGTAVVLGDALIPGAGIEANYYVTSINISATNVISLEPGSTAIKIHDVSVTANQLDTIGQRTNFLAAMFTIKDGSKTLFFDRVTSRGKSLSNRFIIGEGFRVVSATLNMSGEIWADDVLGQPNPESSAPKNINTGFDFFNLFDAEHTAGVGDGSGTGRAYPPAAATVPYPTGPTLSHEFLPTNYEFFLTNINVGEWTPAMKPGVDSVPHWRQTISLSAVVIFDLAGSSSTQPDLVTTTSEQINGQTTKFTQLRVMGFGTVFKAVGIEPSTASQTITSQFKDKLLIDSPGTSPTPTDHIPQRPDSWGFSERESEETKDSFEVRGLTARWSKAWKATSEE